MWSYSKHTVHSDADRRPTPLFSSCTHPLTEAPPCPHYLKLIPTKPRTLVLTLTWVKVNPKILTLKPCVNPYTHLTSDDMRTSQNVLTFKNNLILCVLCIFNPWHIQEHAPVTHTCNRHLWLFSLCVIWGSGQRAIHGSDNPSLSHNGCFWSSKFHLRESVTATKLPCWYEDGGISGSGRIKI